jgi:hypothetical protein
MDEDEEWNSEYQYSDNESDSESIESNESENENLEKILFGDLSDLSSESDDGKVLNKNKQIIDVSAFEIPVFDNLDFEEKKYLPVSYVLSSNMEWYYIERACKSNFGDVKNLSRISNKTMKKIANISQYSLNQKTAKNTMLNIEFLKYAHQRGL